MNKLVHPVRTNIRIRLILALAFCTLVSFLVNLASGPYFVHSELRWDYTEGIITIDQSARDLIKQFQQMDQDINVLVKELGNEDPIFKNKFLNRPLPSLTGKEEWFSVPNVGNSVYHLTRNELIQFIINTTKQHK